MEKYFILNSEESEITLAANTIDLDELRSSCYPKIFSRARNYQQNGMVDELIVYPEENRINATVHGSDQYSLTIELEDKVLTGSCSCPYDGLCKHLVAACIEIVEKGTGDLIAVSVKTDEVKEESKIIDEFLEQSTKEELCEYIKKWAPKSFWESILNKASSEQNAIKKVVNVEKKIECLLDNEELLYSPDAMEDELVVEFDSLKGLEQHAVKQISLLVMKTMEQIDHFTNEGYLYDDYSDGIFCGERISRFAVELGQFMDVKERIKYFQHLSQIEGDSCYDTFRAVYKYFPLQFKESEIGELKNIMMAEFRVNKLSFFSHIFPVFEKTLTIQEKEQCLKAMIHLNRDYFISYLNLLNDQKRFDETYSCLEKDLIDKNHLEDELAHMYLDIVVQTGRSKETAALKLIPKSTSNTILQKLDALDLENMIAIENVAREENPLQLLNFYEYKNRLKDALHLVKNGKVWENDVYRFFVKYGSVFPSDAEEFFLYRIHENLKHTGNHYYECIASTLQQLKKVNPEKTRIMTDMIKKDYKRRRNLMALLN